MESESLIFTGLEIPRDYLWERVEKKDTSRSVIPQYLQF